MKANNYSRLHQTYTDSKNCDRYQIFKTQSNCPQQSWEEYKEPFGAFSISAAVRQPWGGCCGNCNCNCDEKQTATGIN